ncbi:MAG: carotenoid biosynthesis protein [bacterium]
MKPAPSVPLAFPAPPRPSYDRSFGAVAYGSLVAVLLLFSYLHHFQPQVLRVPDNGSVSSWQRPAFEETLIHDQMTAAQRQEIRSRGVVLGKDFGMQLAGDLFTMALAWVCFSHALRHFGFWMASCFLMGSFVFTGLEETLWILSGRFFGGMVHNPLGETFHGTYWFTRGIFWFLETPITACLGWFFIAYSCVLTAGKVFPRMGLWGRATVGGLIAMSIDLWIDPVQTAPEVTSWVWAKGDFLLFFGIPHYNFIGWFLLIFLFAIFWEKLPGMEARYGRAGATNRFFAIVLGVPWLVLFFIWLWLFVLGSLFSWAGVEQAVHVPRGW